MQYYKKETEDFPHSSGDFSYICGSKRCVCCYPKNYWARKRRIKNRKKEREILESMSAMELKLIYAKTESHCAYCGCIPESGNRTIDHILPLSLDGLSVSYNLVLACYPCNLEKGGMMLNEYRKLKGSFWFEKQNIHIYY